MNYSKEKAEPRPKLKSFIEYCADMKSIGQENIHLEHKERVAVLTASDEYKEMNFVYKKRAKYLMLIYFPVFAFLVLYVQFIFPEDPNSPYHIFGLEITNEHVGAILLYHIFISIILGWIFGGRAALKEISSDKN